MLPTTRRQMRLLLLLATAARCASRAKVALVMMDTQAPALHGWTGGRCPAKVDAKSLSIITLTYYLNLAYTRAHGYDLLFYQLQGEGCKDYKCGSGCFHERWGPRHASYCKVAGLGEALAAGYEWVVYVDSDAFVENRTLSLPSLLRHYGDARGLEQDDAFFGWDHSHVTAV